MTLEDRIPTTLYGSLCFFLQSIKTYTPQEEEAISEALAACFEWHREQRRKGGALFAMHPIQVATILAHHKMEPIIVQLGLLHDVLEDTTAGNAAVERRFGKEIVQLLEVVTRSTFISHHEFNTKIFERGRQDVRIAIVKIADRCANLMHHSQLALSAKSHLDNVQETQEFYIDKFSSIPGIPPELKQMLVRTYQKSLEDYQHRVHTDEILENNPTLSSLT